MATKANETKKVKTGAGITSIKYVTPEGLIFHSRQEYLDYMEGLKN